MQDFIKYGRTKTYWHNNRKFASTYSSEEYGKCVSVGLKSRELSNGGWFVKV